MTGSPAGRRVGGGGAVLVRAYAPGRVNLIGDHTDYTGGWVLPMAVDKGTTVELRRHGRRVELVSVQEPEAARVDLGLEPPAPVMAPGWARYLAGVVATLRPAWGGTGVVSSDLPIEAGLSSSSSLTVALALALGFEGTALELARLAQRAETAGSGVPGGIMDQLCSAAGVQAHALLIDCSTLDVLTVALPPEGEVVVAHSGQRRALVGSAYAERRHECERAEAQIGPLRGADPADAETVPDPLVRRRARHVISENARVLAAAAALRAGDLATVGALMNDSHRSLAEDFDVSTPALDEAAEGLRSVRGVYGARLTGAGFGGCVVALARAGTFERMSASGVLRAPTWRMPASAGAWVEVIGGPDRPAGYL